GDVPDSERPGKRMPEVTLLDTATAREEGRLAGNDVRFSPDNKTLFTSRGQVITLWDARTLRKKSELKADAPVRGFQAAFSPDGRLLCAPTYRGVGHLWEVETGKQLAAPEGFYPRCA